MAIRYNCYENNIFIEQISSRPLIYLDNWAINKFSNEENLKNKFIEVLDRKNATIAFSIINLYEIVNRKDNIQISIIIDFIDSVNDALIESNPAIVIDREQKYYNSRALHDNIEPWMYQEFLKTLACNSEPLKPLKVSSAIKMLKKEIDELNYIATERFQQELVPCINAARQNKDKLDKAKKYIKKKTLPKNNKIPYTKELYDFLLWYIVSNEYMKMPDSEWRDVFHTIVPAAYCDFLLIDKRWVRFIETTGLKYPQVANVYSQDKIEDFFDDLEAYI